MDEDSPHMHVVGVLVGTGYKKGMSKQVSKRKVFTKEVLSLVLQDKLRAFANEKAKIVLGEQIREKSKGRNISLQSTIFGSRFSIQPGFFSGKPFKICNIRRQVQTNGNIAFLTVK